MNLVKNLKKKLLNFDEKDKQKEIDEEVILTII